ncbi:hypothetical protein EDB81DRAFT_764797 [Dactylonectria macrodidyma]|uniref:Uncharacterized protein n=1 Tax=Dactylonectria macrodidyma TaxID=307937 RepID=A0A9P9IM88_9HYPO|nr:hypothetical protein EDB81DRAFT_764797 [Dactylonectria macrodidyma]
MMTRRLLLVASLAALATARCFYPDGSEATDREFEPCGGVNTTFATCCIFSEGDECLPNGLCTGPGRYGYRAACESEDGEGCPDVCPMASSDGWVQVKECAVDEYCCNVNREGDCCEDGSDRFSLEERPPTGSLNASGSMPTTAAADPTFETTEHEVANAVAARRKPAARSEASNKKSKSTPVGLVAVGVVGGAAVLGAAGIGLWFRRKRTGAEDVAGSVSDRTGPKSVSGSERSEIQKQKAADRPRRKRRRSRKPPRTPWIAELDAGPGTVVAEVESTPVRRPRKGDEVVVREVHEMPA